MAWKEKQRNKPPAGFHGRATYIHPPIASCMVPLILPNCQDSWISFAFISYPQDTKCCQPAAVCSVSHLLFLFYLPLCLSLSLCLSPWKKKKKKTPGRCGRKRDRWQGWQEKLFGRRRWKSKDVKNRMNPANVHTHTLIHTVYFLLFYMLCVRDINYNYVDVYTHIHTHTPSAHALYNKSLWCFGLEADRHAGECGSLYHHDDGDVIERLCFMSDPCAVGLPVLCRFTLLYCMLCNYYTQSTEADLNM